MTFNVQYEARKFRIWQILKMEDFRCSYAYVAEVLGLNAGTVRHICARQGWVSHWQDDAYEASGRGGSQTVPVDKLMLDRAPYSRIKCYSSED